MCMATTSAVPSPVPPSPERVLMSIPWPYSWCTTSLISPVLLQPPPERKKLTVDPPNDALQVASMLTLEVMLIVSSQATPGSHFLAIRRTWLRW